MQSAKRPPAGHRVPDQMKTQRQADRNIRAYPTYLPPHTELSTASDTPGYQAPIGLDNYLPANHSNAGISQTSSTIMPRAQPPPQDYPFQTPSNTSQPGAQIRFVDSNPRPAKSPRHVAPELSGSYGDYNARFAPPYNGAGDILSARESGYFPTSLPMQQAWTAPTDAAGIYGTPLQGTQPGQQYQYPSEGYPKEETTQQQNYTWNPS